MIRPEKEYLEGYAPEYEIDQILQTKKRYTFDDYIEELDAHFFALMSSDLRLYDKYWCLKKAYLNNTATVNLHNGFKFIKVLCTALTAVLLYNFGSEINIGRRIFRTVVTAGFIHFIFDEIIMFITEFNDNYRSIRETSRIPFKYKLLVVCGYIALLFIFFYVKRTPY